MKKFHKRRGMIVTQLSAYEVELLASLIMQLIELLSDGEPEGFADQSDASDAFEEIVKDLEGEPDEPVRGLSGGVQMEQAVVHGIFARAGFDVDETETHQLPGIGSRTRFGADRLCRVDTGDALEE